jgi:hypothetical protein
MSWLDWVEHHLLPCPFKMFLHIDCPGCGMQRSLVLLFRGEFSQSFFMYPPLLPMLATFIFLALHLKFKFEHGAKVLLTLFIFSTTAILASYIVKQVFLFQQL